MMSADHLFPFVWDKIGSDKWSQPHDLWVFGLYVAARDIKVTAYCHQAGQCPCNVKGMDIVFNWISPLDDCRL